MKLLQKLKSLVRDLTMNVPDEIERANKLENELDALIAKWEQVKPSTQSTVSPVKVDVKIEGQDPEEILAEVADIIGLPFEKTAADIPAYLKKLLQERDTN